MSKEDNIKKGDLVVFFSTYPRFQKDYVSRNPGLVINYRRLSTLHDSVTILWSDGSITDEHAAFIQQVKKEK